mmetsp:Transcript_23497/g.65602  ORF Transcript_23497/g.65602 Transcript_23497/m.65602 type:complete len:258 (-) Transcript_23497:437-1210(-)
MVVRVGHDGADWTSGDWHVQRSFVDAGIVVVGGRCPPDAQSCDATVWIVVHANVRAGRPLAMLTICGGDLESMHPSGFKSRLQWRLRQQGLPLQLLNRVLSLFDFGRSHASPLDATTIVQHQPFHGMRELRNQVHALLWFGVDVQDLNANGWNMISGEVRRVDLDGMDHTIRWCSICTRQLDDAPVMSSLASTTCLPPIHDLSLFAVQVIDELRRYGVVEQIVSCREPFVGREEDLGVVAGCAQVGEGIVVLIRACG